MTSFIKKGRYKKVKRWEHNQKHKHKETRTDKYKFERKSVERYNLLVAVSITLKVLQF